MNGDEKEDNIKIWLGKRGGHEGRWMKLAQDRASGFGNLLLMLNLRVLRSTRELGVANFVKTELKYNKCLE